ncbi:WD repeat-containing protein 81 isoform X2 [Homalodisca vitripennis]|uniref:WD repeat-containing protein 81 isoform X2 n=1 Tax=Homalodisca vitripennis TaxID=197043 RepID=UPI001EEA55C9|nr:WD repeat-containing protein 81 isoform X2 [Homalodisca vitripennis]
MDAADIIHERLKIPIKYLKNFSKSNKVEGIVHRTWIRQLVDQREVPSEFLLHDQLSPAEVEAWFKQGENLGSAWQKLMFTILWKRDCPVIPLPRAKSRLKPETPLSYNQVLHYVSHTNFKNLWKEVYKKYSNGSLPGYMNRSHDRSTVQLTDSASLLREVIFRAYGCPLVPLDGSSGVCTTDSDRCESAFHPNLLPCIVALEAKNYFILVHENVPGHTLLDCVTFSPAILGTNSKMLFLVYQLLCLLRHIHDLGLVLADITLSDIYVDSHLWIQVTPKLEANIYELPPKPQTDQEISSVEKTKKSHDINSLTLAWVRGAMSNLDYLTALNNLAGRRFGDPRCHHVLPWVTDFSSPNGANWRDLTKSKFRLNKGDRQLDLTYDVPPSSNMAQVPHHISDVLSEITYYVYLARVTPRSVLCQHVRPQWVPAEYPSSIQRLQQWTPDECIPELFTDPSVFKSIHPDLPDLELPAWASSAEQLIAHHRAALESNYVSDRLHHWIDLTFGYKLSGQAAVKSKNVCLQLVDKHTGLTDYGVVQLFSAPHPGRVTPSPFWGLTPPHTYRQTTKTGSDEEEGPSSGGEENISTNHMPHSSPLALTRLLSRSRSSLQTSGSSPGDKQGTISLPHDYNPVALLTAVETLHTFTGPHADTTLPAAGDQLSQAAQCKQVVAARRQQEMQVLGCLIVEMFLSNKLRLSGSTLVFAERLSICRKMLSANRDSLPRYVRSLVTLLLDDSGSEAPITSLGTPPPSAHQLLQPALSSPLLPLPPYFTTLYSLVTSLHEHCQAVNVLYRLRETHPDSEEILNSSIQQLSEWKVQSVAKYLQQLVDMSQFSVELVLSYILQLMTDPDTAVSAAWYLFDPISKLLGPTASAKVLLEPLVHLYDCDHSLGSPRQLKKRIKLYHRSFLLRLIVRFRLRVFLDHFITPLVEAVGGYHDVDVTLPVTANEQSDSDVEEATECPSVLSPLDEDSSADSEKTPVVEGKSDADVLETDTELEPEVFVLETDDNVGELNQTEQIASLLLDLQTDDTEDTESQRDTPTHELTREVKGSLVEQDMETWSTDNEEPKKPVTEYNKVSEVGVASMQWLAHRLGPVLTATHLSRNLLRMLSLCYAGQGCSQVHQSQLQGDDSATSVLQCLTSIVGLYGEQFIVLQYLPATADVISLARKKLTSSLEAGVVAHLMLLSHCMPHLSDNTLHQLFQEVILSRVCGPALRLLSSTRQLFPGHVSARRAVVLKLVDCLHALMLRATTQQKIALVHTISRFYLAFSKARGQHEESRGDDQVSKVKEYDAADSFSPPQSNTADGDCIKSKALEELASVMTEELAYWSYIPFSNFFGEPLMEQSLKNYSLIKQLCAEYLQSCDNSQTENGQTLDQQGESDVEDSVGSLGTNVVIIGNRIDLQEPSLGRSASPNTSVPNEDNTDSGSRRHENNSRHLKGNWLSYWQHEVGHTSSQFNIKQIRLLGFSGHGNSVRSLVTLDNENSFLSASRDKTVKVWSLRSMGDGSTTCPAQWTYTGHRKSVLSVGFCEASRLAVSCDSVVHLWDPYVGRIVSQTDPTRNPPVNTLRCLPAPSYQILAATTDPTLRTLDSRVGGYVNELKVAVNSAGLIRCICVAPGGAWVALGQASGFLTVIDLRTGTMLAAWKGHDGEVLQLVAVNDQTIISSSLDQAVSVWNALDGKLKFNIKGSTEPVHCLDLYGGELISGTTANRIGVHTSIDPSATFSSTRLRSDSFRGVLTTLQVLPLNRLLLLGADTGAITLIC